MQLIQNRIPTILVLAIATLSGCGGETDVDRTAAAQEKQSEVAEFTANTRRKARQKTASIILGDQTFDLDIVICTGTSMASVVASDSQKRSDYPVLTVKTFDPAMTGGQSINTASAVFERDGYGEHWKLYAGVVEKDGKIFTASGTLEGSRLMPTSDGTRMSAPFADENIRPFQIRIEC